MYTVEFVSGDNDGRVGEGDGGGGLGKGSVGEGEGPPVARFLCGVHGGGLNPACCEACAQAKNDLPRCSLRRIPVVMPPEDCPRFSNFFRPNCE